MLARNYNNRRIFILQAPNTSYTQFLLSAVATVDYDNHKSSNSTPKSPASPSLQGWRLPEFQKLCQGWGGDKRGREVDLADQLLSIGVDRELVGRITRRFGDFENLDAAYSACDDDEIRIFLLADLSVGGTNTECKSLCCPRETSHSYTTTTTATATATTSHFFPSFMVSQSQLVCQNVRKFSPTTPPHKEGCADHAYLTCPRLVRVQPSQKMIDDIFNSGTHDRNWEAEDVDSALPSYLNITKAHAGLIFLRQLVVLVEACHRCSDLHQVVRLNRLDIVEKLLDATSGLDMEVISEAPLPVDTMVSASNTAKDLAIARAAVAALEINFCTQVSQPLVIIEGLLQTNPNHGGLGKLRSALYRARHGESGVIYLGIGRPCLSTPQAALIDSDTA